MRFTLSIFLLLFYISACNSPEDRTDPFAENITYEPVSTEKSFTFPGIYNPRVIKVVGENLIVTEAEGSPSIHILSIQEDGSLEYQKAIGRAGRGPGEYSMLMDIAATDSLIYAYDGAQLKLVVYDRDYNLLPNKKIKLETIGRPSSFLPVAEQRFAATGLFREDRFQVYDKTGSMIGRHGKIIPIHEDFTSRDNAIAWRSYGTADPQGEHVYLFAANANVIEKYTIDGKLVKRIEGEEVPVPKMKLDASASPVDHGGILAYGGVDTDDEYIYAHYSGNVRSGVDIPEGSNLYEAIEFNKIHKLDWDLNLVKGYELEHVPVAFTADGKGGLYTVHLEPEGTVINHVKLD